MENLGALALLLALCLAVYAVVGSLVGRLKSSPFLVISAQRAVYAVWALVAVASGILLYGLIGGDYRMAYVAAHSTSAENPPTTSPTSGK